MPLSTVRDPSIQMTTYAPIEDRAQPSAMAVHAPHNQQVVPQDLQFGHSNERAIRIATIAAGAAIVSGAVLAIGAVAVNARMHPHGGASEPVLAGVFYTGVVIGAAGVAALGVLQCMKGRGAGFCLPVVPLVCC